MNQRIFLFVIPFCVMMQLQSISIPFYTELRQAWDIFNNKHRIKLLTNILHDGSVTDFKQDYDSIQSKRTQFKTNRYAYYKNFNEFEGMENMAANTIHCKLEEMPEDENARQIIIKKYSEYAYSTGLKSALWLGFGCFFGYQAYRMSNFDYTLLGGIGLGLSYFSASEYRDAKKSVARLTNLDITAQEYLAKRNLLVGKCNHISAKKKHHKKKLESIMQGYYDQDKAERNDRLMILLKK